MSPAEYVVVSIALAAFALGIFVGHYVGYYRAKHPGARRVGNSE